MVGMENLQVGDWVRTASGHEGKVVLLYLMSACIDYENESHSGPPTCLQSELTKIEPPTRPENNPPPEH